MNFVADEGVDIQIVDVLSINGYDVLYIIESNPSISDEEVLTIANEENRILMTRDKDFGELIYRDKMIHSGIVLNRLYELSAEMKAALVLKAIQEYETKLMGSFTVIEPGSVRIREL